MSLFKNLSNIPADAVDSIRLLLNSVTDLDSLLSLYTTINYKLSTCKAIASGFYPDDITEDTPDEKLFQISLSLLRESILSPELDHEAPYDTTLIDIVVCTIVKQNLDVMLAGLNKSLKYRLLSDSVDDVCETLWTLNDEDDEHGEVDHDLSESTDMTQQANGVLDKIYQEYMSSYTKYAVDYLNHKEETVRSMALTSALELLYNTTDDVEYIVKIKNLFLTRLKEIVVEYEPIVDLKSLVAAIESYVYEEYQGHKMLEIDWVMKTLISFIASNEMYVRYDSKPDPFDKMGKLYIETK